MHRNPVTSRGAWLKSALWALAVGAVCTVGIAWAGALCSNTEWDRAQQWSWVVTQEVDGKPVVQQFWAYRTWSDWTGHRMLGVSSLGDYNFAWSSRRMPIARDTATPIHESPLHAELAAVPADMRQDGDGSLVELRGWPWLALEGSERRAEVMIPQDMDLTFARQALRLQSVDTRFTALTRLLPLSPRWGGFAADAALFGSCFWVLQRLLQGTMMARALARAFRCWLVSWRLGAACAVGAIATVAVSWALAVGAPVNTPSPATRGFSGVRLPGGVGTVDAEMYASTVALRQHSSVVSFPRVAQGQALLQRTADARRQTNPLPGLTPTVSHVLETTESSEGLPLAAMLPWTREELLAGWPLLAMRGYADESGTPASLKRYGCLVLSSDSSTPLAQAALVPLLPAWPGFAVNTALFAAAVLAVCIAFSTARGFRRMRAGRCLVCGYAQAKSTVCPECGADFEGKLPAGPARSKP